jgi:hypothetical protein
MSFLEKPANTGPVRGVALSLCRKIEDEGPHFGVCLCGPISVSRFHKRIAGAIGAERATMRPIVVVKPRLGRRACEKIQRANPNAARWSAQTQGTP